MLFVLSQLHSHFTVTRIVIFSVHVLQLRTSMITIGFTLSYGTMFAKVLHSWHIFKKAKESKTPTNKTIISTVSVCIPQNNYSKYGKRYAEKRG